MTIVSYQCTWIWYNSGSVIAPETDGSRSEKPTDPSVAGSLLSASLLIEALP